MAPQIYAWNLKWFYCFAGKLVPPQQHFNE